jgi:hypothetical protein
MCAHPAAAGHGLPAAVRGRPAAPHQGHHQPGGHRANLAVAVALLLWASRAKGRARLGVYLPGNWDVPFGIVLVLDRLSALMLVLTAWWR